MLGFTWEQLHLVLGFLAALMAVGWFVTDVGKRDVGLWVEVIGGIALAVGAANLQREREHRRVLTMPKAKLSAANALILGAGVVMLLGSFLSFYDRASAHRCRRWSRGLFGIATVVVFCGGVMAGQVALATFGSRPMSPRPFGLTWDQVHLALGFQAAVMMLALPRAEPARLHRIRDRLLADVRVGDRAVRRRGPAPSPPRPPLGLAIGRAGVRGRRRPRP